MGPPRRRRRDEERRSLIALVVEHARARSDPEEDLHLRTVTPGLLAKHTTGRGTSKQRQCWAIDAATLQVPDRESRGKEFALAVQDEC